MVGQSKKMVAEQCAYIVLDLFVVSGVVGFSEE
jgi:hypothetical protein